MRKLGKAIGAIVMAGSLACAFATGASAQHHARDSRQYFDYGDPLASSMLQSPDGKTVEVRVNTASSMFSFLRAQNGFYAIRDLTITVNEEGNSEPLVTRDRIDTIFVKNFEQSTAKDDWHAASEEIALPEMKAGKRYSVRIEVRDNVDHLMMRPITAPLRNPQFANVADSNGIGIGDALLFDTQEGTVGASSALGNSYMFGRDFMGAVQFKLADTLKGDPIVDIRVRQVTNAIDPADTGERAHVALSASDLKKDAAFALQRASSKLLYTLQPKNGVWTAMFTVPGKTFEQGTYEIAIRVKDGAAEKTMKNTVNVVWQGMPLSLEDPVDAIEPLTHIMSKEQVATISSGTKQEQIRKLYKYWKSQDPTPGTAYNERMATFYQRVDYADFNYANTRMLNGAMTDRGKIYLLYGAPTSVERSFIPGEMPIETWTYSNNVQRIFHFEDPTTHGEYRLTGVDNLATVDPSTTAAHN
jgi:GWxTD domain-containing protein